MDVWHSDSADEERKFAAPGDEEAVGYTLCDGKAYVLLSMYIDEKNADSPLLKRSPIDFRLPAAQLRAIYVEACALRSALNDTVDLLRPVVGEAASPAAVSAPARKRRGSGEPAARRSRRKRRAKAMDDFVSGEALDDALPAPAATEEVIVTWPSKRGGLIGIGDPFKRSAKPLEERLYIVNDFVDRRINADGNEEALVRWKNYNDAQNEWVLVSQLTEDLGEDHVRSLLAECDARKAAESV